MKQTHLLLILAAFPPVACSSGQSDDATAAQMRDVTVVLGSWNPEQ